MSAAEARRPEAAAAPRACPECGEGVAVDVRACPACGVRPPCLEVLAGNDAGTVFALWPGEHGVGRSSECDIVLHDRSISRRHAHVVNRRGRVTLLDLGGTNGVLVGPDRVESAVLAAGHVVQLGRTVLRFVPAPEDDATTERLPWLLGAMPAAPEASRQAALLALDRLNMGVLLLGAGSDVLAVNASARTILEAGEGLSLGPHGLRCADAQAGRKLRALLAGEPDPTSTGAVLVPRDGRRPLTLLLAPLGGEGAAVSLRALFVSDPERGIESGETVMSRLYGLTAAEARLTGELLEGKSLELAAESLGITIHTARTHLRRVFAKTDTRRQSELVLLLLSGPAQVRSR